jgi:hypothetical protein
MPRLSRKRVVKTSFKKRKSVKGRKLNKKRKSVRGHKRNLNSKKRNQRISQRGAGCFGKRCKVAPMPPAEAAPAAAAAAAAGMDLLNRAEVLAEEITALLEMEDRTKIYLDNETKKLKKNGGVQQSIIVNNAEKNKQIIRDKIDRKILELEKINISLPQHNLFSSTSNHMGQNNIASKPAPLQGLPPIRGNPQRNIELELLQQFTANSHLI